MKKMILAGILLLMSFAIYAETEVNSVANTATSTSDRYQFYDKKDIKIDIVKINSQDNEIGVDYKILLEKLSFTNIAGKTIGYSLQSEGFFSTTNMENKSNSILNKVKIQLDLPGLLNETAGKDTDDTVTFTRPLLSVFWDLNVGHETTQTFNAYDLSIGTSLSIRTPYLSDLLNVIGSILGANEDNNATSIEMNVGYSYVFNMDNAANTILNKDQVNSNRLDLLAACKIGVLGDDRIYFKYKAFYEPNAPQLIKDAKKDFNQFFELKYVHVVIKDDKPAAKKPDSDPITKIPLGLTLKYTYGELPPSGSSLGGGIAIEFK
jgi:hypothetical protein